MTIADLDAGQIGDGYSDGVVGTSLGPAVAAGLARLYVACKPSSAKQRTAQVKPSMNAVECDE